MINTNTAMKLFTVGVQNFELNLTMHMLQILKVEFHKCVTSFTATGCVFLFELTVIMILNYRETFHFDTFDS
jgi:hypothetical protein